MKKLLKAFIISSISIILLNLIITLFNYVGLINYNIVNILKYFIPLISLFIGGLYLGKNSLNKGYLEGLKLGLIFVLIFLIINIFGGFNIKQLILYIITICGSIIGSIIGINKKAT